jgi:hypothetical protein
MRKYEDLSRIHENALSPRAHYIPYDTLDKALKGDKFTSKYYTLLNGEWKQEWHDICVRETERFIGALTNAYNADSTERQNHVFAHYLDCEAHTDVWRELCPTWNQTNEK